MDGHSLPLCPSPPLLSLTLAPPPLPNTTKMHQNEQIPPSFSASLLIFSTLLLPFDPTTLSPRPSPPLPFPGTREIEDPQRTAKAAPSVPPTLLRIQRFLCLSRSTSQFAPVPSSLLLLILFTAEERR